MDSVYHSTIISINWILVIINSIIAAASQLLSLKAD